jgi:hypothetical protein
MNVTRSREMEMACCEYETREPHVSELSPGHCTRRSYISPAWVFAFHWVARNTDIEQIKEETYHMIMSLIAREHGSR